VGLEIAGAWAAVAPQGTLGIEFDPPGQGLENCQVLLVQPRQEVLEQHADPELVLVQVVTRQPAGAEDRPSPVWRSVTMMWWGAQPICPSSGRPIMPVRWFDPLS
jgi:hypothetical protein